MRLTALTISVLALLALAAPSGIAQQLAIPTTIKSISKSPSKIGRLILLHGYLVTSDGETRLQEADSNQEAILDFSQSSVTARDLMLNGMARSPIEVTGRVSGKKNGDPILTVIWASPLTPPR